MNIFLKEIMSHYQKHCAQAQTNSSVSFIAFAAMFVLTVQNKGDIPTVKRNQTVEMQGEKVAHVHRREGMSGWEQTKGLGVRERFVKSQRPGPWLSERW